ncbi:MAG: gliding motility-associated C-terminal domain-containing protein, partial [Saprospiraceae bacterium]|nr:gliding motility-associated C-terminal domain-containing protein [Saprospiraceae bacterium]
SLTIFDPNLCSITLFANILVKTDRRLYVPNVFSPNGDGVNEFVTVFSPSDVVQIDFFEVFSRWGEIIFKRSNFPPNTPELGWDGTFAGEQLMPGVYVYHARVQYSDGVTETIKGDVTLLR